MNPHALYQECNALAWTRIDMVLALFDGAIDRLEKALVELHSGREPEAKALLARAALLVAELTAGVDLRCGELPEYLVRLYEFSLHGISRGTVQDVEAALNVLRVLRDGFRDIRPEAVRLEQSGMLPPLDGRSSLEATA